jgi:hypothetical protein
LGIKEQETRLTLHEHDDDDDFHSHPHAEHKSIYRVFHNALRDYKHLQQ